MWTVHGSSFQALSRHLVCLIYHSKVFRVFCKISRENWWKPWTKNATTTTTAAAAAAAVVSGKPFGSARICIHPPPTMQTIASRRQRVQRTLWWIGCAHLARLPKTITRHASRLPKMVCSASCQCQCQIILASKQVVMGFLHRFFRILLATFQSHSLLSHPGVWPWWSWLWHCAFGTSVQSEASISCQETTKIPNTMVSL
mmetsp:Transcript_10262/g.25769  ORF Transcript_10262/g.25769 Transcript_10262/m.25769 type:complete len:200 (-) Transcript_10262:294-893(-)